jgi:hypothetical protein
MGRRLWTFRAWSLAVVALLITAACAGARPAITSHTATRAMHRSAPPRTPQHGHVTHGAAPARLIGVGNVPGCLTGSPNGLSVLQTYHATVLRLVISPGHGDGGQALPCVRAAVAAGDKVHVAIGYGNRWSTGTVVSYFKRVLASYARYAWAISIGGEQELTQGGGKSTGARYSATWRAVEPVVARLAPHAIRVAGEISPWGIQFLSAAYTSGLPGAQAIAVHGYFARYGFSLPQIMAWNRRTRLPLWITEGLLGPGSWPAASPRMRDVPLSAMAGAAVADAWLG